ncbi:MAG: ABC-F family ATP-binding cassette domain-containing protein [Oscillospiraceae bacterium]
MIANLENIDKFYNGNQVLNGINLTINDSDRLGLIGINGCGKSTLLRILTKKELPDNGDISVTNGVTIGFLEQNTGLDRSSTIIAEMTSVFAKLLAVQERMHEIEGEIARISHETDSYSELSAEYSRISAYFEANDGYLVDVKIKTVLNGMGFEEKAYNTPISTLSGGEKTRLALSKLLLENPSLLILDEPTNHLDFDTIMWLEDYLLAYKGAILVVSHDRYFLNKLATSIAEIEKGKLTRYKGNYSAYLVQKEAAIVRQEKEFELQQVQIAHLQEYVDKNLVRATTSKSAKSRVKTLEKMERIDKPTAPPKEAKIRFEFDVVPPKDVLFVENIDLVAGKGESKKALADDVTFEVKRGEKIALVGANGIGKSSLLKVIQNKLPHKKGKIEWAKNVKISYFEQENAQLNPENSVIDELHNRFPAMTEQAVRTALGCVRLTGENVFKTVGVISGGERAKLCFAIIMQERANVLVLDEPTNHLDLGTKEALEEALEAYEGTIIFVSHDRYLLNKISSRVLEITIGQIEDFDCGFDEYIERKKAKKAALLQAQELEKGAAKKANAAEKNVKLYRGKEQRNADVQRKKRLKELEDGISSAEEQISALELEMTTPEVFSDYQLMNEKCEKIASLKEFLTAQTDEWLDLSDNN